MIGYVMVGTNNLPAATSFYDELLPIIGLKKTEIDKREIGYAPSSGIVEFWICTPFDEKPATIGNGSMVSFKTNKKEIVDQLHKKALELGGANEGNPGFRPSNGSVYYAYFRDLDGNKFCIYC